MHSLLKWEETVDGYMEVSAEQCASGVRIQTPWLYWLFRSVVCVMVRH
jgi:hypothetical protein